MSCECMVWDSGQGRTVAIYKSTCFIQAHVQAANARFIVLRGWDELCAYLKNLCTYCGVPRQHCSPWSCREH